MLRNLSVVGLTGGIASGKSLAASIFREMGIPVIDADALAHMVLAPDGLAYAAVLEAFGDDILVPGEDTIDRQRLGQKVFDNAPMRHKLEAITHPAIAQLAKQGMALVAERGEKLAIYEAALLVEAGIYRDLQALVVVATTLENQLSRLCQRDRMTPHAAAARIASQLPLEEKLAVADYVIENNGTYDAFREAVVALGKNLQQRFA
ncbi:MAG: dephospho-CoA kinase [Myxococcales bacterium]|jgi:dephospho-CoA kinase|nr:dephospho-CoA kinase [Myxococcales bacterium]